MNGYMQSFYRLSVFAVALSSIHGQDLSVLRGPARGLSGPGVTLVREAGGNYTVLQRLKSEGAAALRVHFEDFALTENSQLYVYGLDVNGGVTAIAGPYRGSGPLSTGEFWSRPVP